MILSAILFSASAIGCALASSFNELVIYRIIGGVGIGVVSIISPLYISEVSVPQYRGRLVSLYQLAITIGFLGAYLVNYQLVLGADAAAQSSNQWIVKIFSDEIWRGCWVMETVPALLFFLIIFFIPESPRWLVLKNKEMRQVVFCNEFMAVKANRGTNKCHTASCRRRIQVQNGLYFAGRYTQSSNYRGIHRYLRAIHGSECRTLLWPVYLSGKWHLQWRFSFLPGVGGNG